MEWAHGQGMDADADRGDADGRHRRRPLDQYVPLSLVRARLAKRYHADRPRRRHRRPGALRARRETGGKLGFITPMTHNFCESCNRVRITCTGTLHTCLGQEDAADLRKPLRASADNELL
jgi:cyclic pyranopterin phosphate synthase